MLRTEKNIYFAINFIRVQKLVLIQIYLKKTRRDGRRRN